MRRGWILAIIIVTLLALCVCALRASYYGLELFLLNRGEARRSVLQEVLSPTLTPDVIWPTEAASATDTIIDPNDTLAQLMSVEVPTSDLRDLAGRLEGKKDIPLTLDTVEGSYPVGSRQIFWVSNVDTNENRQINTTLQYVTDHVYFWIQDGVEFDYEALQSLVDTFEEEIYPRNRQIFGSEWTPGVDGDAHLYIIYARDLGRNLAGGFSSADESLPLAQEYSNGHESFMLNADNVDLKSEFAYGVLAHEFQHMIHWNQDRNESSWLNEGFSELAVLINGYRVGSEYSYIADPDIQLNDWPDYDADTSAHYGAAFLFSAYLLDRFGEQLIQEVIADPANGLDGIDQVLARQEIRDPISGIQINAGEVFSDWVVASFLNDESVSDGRYTYQILPEAPQAEATETIDRCPSQRITRDVHQFGVDYIQINCPGVHTLRFEGSSLVNVIPVDPYSGDYYFWSNAGDEADITLTRNFDFTAYEGPLTLTFATWYDLEEDYDYVYLEVSEDGEDWQILNTPSGTSEDPSGNSYGWAYNGATQAWIQESVDLSAFSGKKVQIRFEYVTDSAVHGEGMVIDDVAIPEVGYFTDFEEGDDGWEADGWVRMNNIIPQTYRLSLIAFGDTIEVNPILLNESNSADIELNTEQDIDHFVLVISGSSRFSRQKAPYRIEVN